MGNEAEVLIEVPATNAPEAVNVEVATEAGLSEKEIEMGKKHGMIEKEQTAEEKVAADKKATDEAATKAKADSDKKAEDAALKPEAGKAKAEDAANEDLSPEKEHEVLQSFNPNEKALYWGRKKERVKRQNAEIERDHTLTKLKAAEEELAKLKSAPAKPVGEAKPKEGDDDLNLDDILGGTDGKPKDDKDKPITQADLERIEAEKAAKQKEADDLKAKNNEVAKDRATKITLKLNEQEIEAKSVYEDFDAVSDLAVDLMKNVETIFKDQPKMKAKVTRMAEDFFRTSATCIDGIQDETAADIIYELGKLSPKYGKTEKPKEDADSAAALAEKEKADRIARNAEKRSSAALSGTGAKTINANDLTATQLASLPIEEYRKVPKAIRDKILGRKT